MGKAQLIREIVKVCGRDANPDYLKTRTVGQLRETLARWQAINRTTQHEINRHCDTRFIK